MSELFHFTYDELVGDADDETGTPLYRLTINDDYSFELTDVDATALLVNTAGFLRKIYHSGHSMSPTMRCALAANTVISLEWLRLCPPPITDARLHDKGVQVALLASAAKAFSFCGHDQEAMMQGALDLLQARAAVFPAVKEACTSSGLHEINLMHTNPARYQNLMMAARRDEAPTPDFDEIEAALRDDLHTALIEAQEQLRQVLFQWTDVAPKQTDQPSAYSATIATYLIDELTKQYDDQPERNMVLTKDMENELVRMTHEFTWQTLTEMCEEGKLAMLVVAGPGTGQILPQPDRHGVGRPQAIFPLATAASDKTEWRQT